MRGGVERAQSVAVLSCCCPWKGAGLAIAQWCPVLTHCCVLVPGVLQSTITNSRAFIRAAADDDELPVPSPTFLLQHIYTDHKGRTAFLPGSLKAWQPPLLTSCCCRRCCPVPHCWEGEVAEKHPAAIHPHRFRQTTHLHPHPPPKQARQSTTLICTA